MAKVEDPVPRERAGYDDWLIIACMGRAACEDMLVQEEVLVDEEVEEEREKERRKESGES